MSAGRIYIYCLVSQFCLILLRSLPRLGRFTFLYCVFRLLDVFLFFEGRGDTSLGIYLF